jgi:hypothetical protein
VRPHVRTAVPLTDEERGVLSAKLGRALGGRQVMLTEVVDRAILGGFIAESGSVVLAGSLEGQLDRMRRRLASGWCPVSNASLQRLILRKIAEAQAVQMKGRGSLLCSRT